MEKLSFIIACYRSEKTIEFVIDEIIQVVSEENYADYEIIIVDDFSPDNVFEILKRKAALNKKIKVIHMAKNCGQHSAIMAGLKYSTGDICVYLDDDGQCPIDKLSDLLFPLENGWDVAIASYPKKRQGFVKNFGSKLNESLTGWLTDKPQNIQLSNFLAIRKYLVDIIVEYSGPYPAIGSLIFRSTKNVISVPMEERERLEGTTTYTFKKLVGLLFSNLLGFTIRPLRCASLTGMIVALGGLIYAIILIIRKIMYPSIIPGYSSLMAVILIVGGLNLLFLGVLGEYIGRIYMTQNRTPQYCIKEMINIENDN